MTKKESDLTTRLLDLLEANTKVMGTVYELLLKMTNPEPMVVPGEVAVSRDEVVTVTPDEVDDPPEAPEPAKTEITPEYCRKALKAISKKCGTEEAKAFLASFGDAKTVPQLDEKYYEDFIAGATKMMGGK